MTALSALIVRLAQATGPDPELDRAIAAARGATTTYDLAACPEYTKSVDAALTLVPKGWCWLLRNHDGKPSPDGEGIGMRGFANIHADSRCAEFIYGWAATPTLALCLASLRAIDSGRTE